METKTRPQLILSPEQVDEWVVSYESTGKLPKLNIPCNKCHTGIVAGHDNLRNKVKKYGNIRTLLTTFICRDCKTGTTTASIKPISSKIAERITKKVVKSDEKKKIVVHEIPKVNPNPINTRYSIEDLASNESLAREFTTGVCIRPQLFLNNDRNCDDCVLYTNCGCNVKTLSKSKRKQLNETSHQLR